MSKKNSNKSQLTPRACPYCERFMDEIFLEERLKRKKAEKLLGMKETMDSKRRAGIPIGRRPNRDYEPMIALYEKGHSVESISKELKCSKRLVNSAIAYDKKRKEFNPINFVLAGNLSEYLDFINTIIEHSKGKVLRTNHTTFVIGGFQHRYIYDVNSVRGCRNFKIIKYGRWFNRDRMLIAEVEEFEKRRGLVDPS